MWLDEVKKSIDQESWNQIQALAWMNPVAFWSCFNVRGCRTLGKNRLQWLRVTAQARLDTRDITHATDFENLIIRAIKVGTGEPDRVEQ